MGNYCVYGKGVAQESEKLEKLEDEFAEARADLSDSESDGAQALLKDKDINESSTLIFS